MIILVNSKVIYITAIHLILAKLDPFSTKHLVLSKQHHHNLLAACGCIQNTYLYLCMYLFLLKG